MFRKVLSAVFIVFMLLMTYYYWPEKELPANSNITKVEIHKSERKLLLLSGAKILKVYPISIGKSPIGAKHKKGDGKTPEGKYVINGKNPKSDYHLNLGISYPTNEQKSLALAARVNPGGDIKIHGVKNGFGFIHKFQRWYDWTNGCIALTNQEIEELYQHVNVGTPIEIFP